MKLKDILNNTLPKTKKTKRVAGNRSRGHNNKPCVAKATQTAPNDVTECSAAGDVTMSHDQSHMNKSIRYEFSKPPDIVFDFDDGTCTAGDGGGGAAYDKVTSSADYYRDLLFQGQIEVIHYDSEGGSYALGKERSLIKTNPWIPSPRSSPNTSGMTSPLTSSSASSETGTESQINCFDFDSTAKSQHQSNNNSMKQMFSPTVSMTESGFYSCGTPDTTLPPHIHEGFVIDAAAVSVPGLNTTSGKLLQHQQQPQHYISSSYSHGDFTVYRSRDHSSILLSPSDEEEADVTSSTTSSSTSGHNHKRYSRSVSDELPVAGDITDCACVEEEFDYERDFENNLERCDVTSRIGSQDDLLKAFYSRDMLNEMNDDSNEDISDRNVTAHDTSNDNHHFEREDDSVMNMNDSRMMHGMFTKSAQESRVNKSCSESECCDDVTSRAHSTSSSSRDTVVSVDELSMKGEGLDRIRFLQYLDIGSDYSHLQSADHDDYSYSQSADHNDYSYSHMQSADHNDNSHMQSADHNDYSYSQSADHSDYSHLQSADHDYSHLQEESDTYSAKDYNNYLRSKISKFDCIRQDLQDNIRQLRHEQVLIDNFVQIAREEEADKERERMRITRETNFAHKQVLLRTLSGLRDKLDSQTDRLQKSYDEILAFQFNATKYEQNTRR